MSVIKEFPLYEQLKEEVEADKSQVFNLQQICTTINSMHHHILSPNDSEGGKQEVMNHLNAIGALIYHHNLVESNGVVFGTIPYAPKSLDKGKGYQFTMTNLPPVLQHIIARYVLSIAK